MKNIHFIAIVFSSLFCSCATGQIQNNGQIVGYEKYNSKTNTFIDNLNRDVIPKILKEYYYNSLTDSDFFPAKIEISKMDSTRSVILESRPAKSGYKYINKFSNKFINNHLDVIYTLDLDTVNSIDKVIHLISLERSKIKSVDTLKTINNYEIRIKTK